MSYERSSKKRCIINKLDFENCVVTRVPTSCRRKTKLRARITRESINLQETPEKSSIMCKSLNNSPVLSQKSGSVHKTKSSPVLIRKLPKCKRSSAFLNKRRLNFTDKEIVVASGSICSPLDPSQTSPVFKLRIPKAEYTNKSEINNLIQKRTNFNSNPKFSSLLERASSIDNLDLHMVVSGEEQHQKTSIKIKDSEKKIKVQDKNMYCRKVMKTETESIKKNISFCNEPSKSFNNILHDEVFVPSCEILFQNEELQTKLVEEETYQENKSEDIGKLNNILKVTNDLDFIGFEISSSSQENPKNLSIQIDDSTPEFQLNSEILIEKLGIKTENLKCFVNNCLTPKKKTSESLDNLSSSNSGPSWPEIYLENNEPIRKRNKKNILLNRLMVLLKRQSSEKLLWQHRKQRKVALSSKRLYVIKYWKDEYSFIVSCCTLASESESDLSKNLFLIVDSRWVPCAKKIQEGCVLLLYPPWQTLSVGESNISVLVSVICLEVLDEIIEPVINKKFLETIPCDPYETNEKLFVESMFSSYSSGYLF